MNACSITLEPSTTNNIVFRFSVLNKIYNTLYFLLSSQYALVNDPCIWPGRKKERKKEIETKKTIWPCDGGMTDRVIKENVRENTAAWRNSGSSYWKAAGSEVWCRGHAGNSTSTVKVLCPRRRAAEKVTFPSNFLLVGKVHAIQHKSGKKSSLRLMVTSVGHS